MKSKERFISIFRGCPVLVRSIALWASPTSLPLSYHGSLVICVTWRSLSEDTFNNIRGAAGDLKYSYVEQR